MYMYVCGVCMYMSEGVCTCMCVVCVCVCVCANVYMHTYNICVYESLNGSLKDH